MLENIARSILERFPHWLSVKIIRAAQKKFTVSVAAVITNPEGKVLLLEHFLRPGAGWGIPGGFIEHGEQPEEAIRREIDEETGLRLEELRLLRVRTIGRHVEILFRAESDGAAEAKSREIKTARWFRIGEMPEKMSPVQKKIIEQVLGSEI